MGVYFRNNYFSIFKNKKVIFLEFDVNSRKPWYKFIPSW